MAQQNANFNFATRSQKRDIYLHTFEPTKLLVTGGDTY